jgi:hypothetical protein
MPWLVAALTLVAAMHAIEPLPVGVFYDDAQYVILAKALATGKGYRFLNLPGTPLATHFPPGYPAFLALLWRLAPNFPENVALLKFANAGLLACAGFLVFRFARRRLELPLAIALAASLAGTAAIPALVLSSAIMSEPLFLVALLPVLVWSERATQTTVRDDTRRQLGTALAIGACIGMVALIRTHGVALTAAVVATYISRGRRRAAIACALGSLMVLTPWVLWVALHNDGLPELVRGAYGSYSSWLTSGFRTEGWHLLAVTVPDNLATIGISTVRSITPGNRPLLDVGIGLVFAGFTVAGLRLSWRRARVLTAFTACYFAIVLVWPFSPLRFIWAIWPLLMLFPAMGIVVMWRTAAVRRGAGARIAVAAAAAMLAISLVVFNALGFTKGWWSSNARFHARRVLPQIEWVARFTSERDIIASDAEGAVYLYTGRQGVPLTTFTSAEYARERTVAEETAIASELLDLYRPSYVLVTSRPFIDATARIAVARPKYLVRVDSLSNGVVYTGPSCTRVAGKTSGNRCD